MMKRIVSLFLLQLMIGGAVFARVPVEVHPNQQGLLESDDPQLASKKISIRFLFPVAKDG